MTRPGARSSTKTSTPTTITTSPTTTTPTGTSPATPSSTASAWTSAGKPSPPPPPSTGYPKTNSNPPAKPASELDNCDHSSQPKVVGPVRTPGQPKLPITPFSRNHLCEMIVCDHSNRQTTSSARDRRSGLLPYLARGRIGGNGFPSKINCPSDAQGSRSV